MIVVRLILALLILAFLALNIIRYPWHTLVFVVFGVALSLLAGGGGRLKALLDASPHPAVRRAMAACATFTTLVHGVPPYNEGRWWVVRTLAQTVYWAVMLVAAAAVLVALGGVFVWLDKQL